MDNYMSGGQMDYDKDSFEEREIIESKQASKFIFGRKEDY